MHLKGKGHEFSDVARLLNYYQLWLDNLYPRAKFADGLQLIEKVGHSKRMQIMRKEWIDEGKPGYLKDKGRKKQNEERETDDLYGDERQADKHDPNTAAADGDDSLFIPDTRPSGTTANTENDMPEDDDLDALLAEQETAPAQRSTFRSRAAKELESEGEDDLDALLAEQETRRAPLSTASAPKSVSKPNPSPFEDEDDDLDDLDALLAEQETRVMPSIAQSRPGAHLTTQEPSKPSTSKEAASSKPSEDEAEDLLDDLDDDDLDGLLAEQEARQSISFRPQSPAPSRTATRTTHAAGDETPGTNAEAEGDDMFTSSPVQTIANSTAEVSRHHQPRKSGSVPSSAPVGNDDSTQLLLPVGSGERDLAAAEEVITNTDADAHAGKQAPEEGREPQQEEVAEAEAEEALEDLEADDMFSSSPVQND